MERELKRRLNFMQIAEDVSHMATCDRAHVGCVLVRDQRIISTGYNGSPPGLPHCDDVGHDIEDGHCIRTVHAEINAILHCAASGVSTRGATCFTTVHPCVRCASALYSAGILEVFYKKEYKTMTDRDKYRIHVLEAHGMSFRS